MDRQRVLVDGVAFQNTQQRGIQRYYFEMLRRLPDSLRCTLFFNQPYLAMLPQGLDIICRTEMFPVSRRKVLPYSKRALQRLFWPTPLPKASVFHSTFFTRSPIPGLPEVVTVHDLVPECMPCLFAGQTEPHVAQKRDCLLNATAIIAISEATRNDLIRIYPEVFDRITVIHHGADHLQSPEVEPQSDKGEHRYVLFVGDRSGYKNFSTMIAAVAEREWPRDVKLKLVGKEFSAAERRMLQAHGIESKAIHAGLVTDAELKQLYQQAEAFVFPSLCEGFGFPLLEAQGMGVPVLASDIPVFRELAGESAVLFNPTDPQSIARSVIRILEPSEAKRFVMLGKENIRRFTWKNCAQKTAEVFHAAAQS